jgi:hypothetical protein
MSSVYYSLQVRLTYEQEQFLSQYTKRTKQSRTAVLRQLLDAFQEKDQQMQKRQQMQKANQNAHDSQFA